MYRNATIWLSSAWFAFIYDTHRLDTFQYLAKLVALRHRLLNHPLATAGYEVQPDTYCSVQDEAPSAFVHARLTANPAHLKFLAASDVI